MFCHLYFNFFVQQYRPLLSVGILFFTLHALGVPPLLPQPPTQSNRHNIDFSTVSQGLNKFGFPPEMGQAIVKVSVGGPTSMERAENCSGSFVSDQGHILLAAHCLTKCNAKVFEGLAAGNGEHQCRIQINGKDSTASVVVASRCRHENLIIRSETYAPSVQCKEHGDIAIILPKSIPEPEGSGFRCLRIDSLKKSPRLNEEVIVMGFPKKTERPLRGNSDGVNPTFSHGKIIKSATCEKRENGKLVRKRLVEYLNAIDSIEKRANRLRYIQTTTDGYLRQSGAPLIRMDGAIIGVLSQVDLSNTDQEECVGSTFYESVSKLEKMATDWNSLLELKSLSCEERAAVPTKQNYPQRKSDLPKGSK